MEILLKKAHSGSYPGLVQPSASPRLKTSWSNGASGQGKPKLTNAVDDEMADFLEWEIRLRLFYIHQLTSLKQEGQKEKLEEMKWLIKNSGDLATRKTVVVEGRCETLLHVRFHR